MIDFFTRTVVWLRQRSFFQATQRTLVMLMPIAVLGSYFQLLFDLVFSPNGLIYNIFGLDKILSDHLWYAGSFVSRGMVQVTFGVFGVYATYFMARYTARIYRRDSTMAGMAAVLVILFCSYASSSGRDSRMPFTASLLQVDGVFIALIIGYCVGQVFHLLGKRYVLVKRENVKWIRHRAWASVLPMVVSLILGIILGVIIYELQLKMLNSASFNEIVSRMQTTNNLAEGMLLSAVITLLGWLGIGYPLRSMSGTINNAYTAENLTYALHHGNSWNVPYKFLGSSLINNYGTMGGTSIVLAIIVVLLLRQKNHEIEALALLSLLPVAFSSTLGFAVGMPLILNPLFILPILVLPLINMLLAACAISLHILPVSVYPILKGTPGILIPFFGTNGDWVALVFPIILLVLDACLLLPIIKIGEKIEPRLNPEQEGAINAQK
ncbi:PTS sugar transporter subunit IIC [Lactobacillus sp. ESL0679]|uniref:PTS sugar transporter subunit IIC n=1 Tax=Lactobacillus sp. ESL0679 TaxID=2983209 RepID=UPI0023F8FABE|nr:PTS sugar transporter subunit IIC [Lactobacillus sp. ESL0679]MDF7682426.1 PTS sugar transporter subunit IIC [Lactobacillus sp. ESL0679]